MRSPGVRGFAAVLVCSLILASFLGPRLAADPFIRGDGNADGSINMTDVISTLSFLFLGGAAPVCQDAADTDDNGLVQLTDAIYTLNFLFSGGAQPPAPWPGCGEDPGEDKLGCADFPPCAGARPVILGDANCDGVVDQDDGEIIRDHVTMGLELCCRAAADATGDGIVNVNDAVRILNVLIDAKPIPVDCDSED